MRENELVELLPRLLVSDDPGLIVGSGPDDCAHVRVDSGRMALSTDVFAEGSHFLADASPRDVAWKCLGASVSDLAASACRPRWALVGLCLKKGAPGEWTGEFSLGLASAASRCGTTIIGGDTVSSPQGTFVSVTVAGEPLPGGPVLRSGGCPGDVLVVTGSLGGSILGRHLHPEPCWREMAALMAFCAGPGGGVFPHAAMDISDGLALDLSRLCRESGTGAFVDGDAVPVSEDALRQASADGRTPLQHALGDGEDFELLLALPPGVWEAFAEFWANGGACEGTENTGVPFTRIGILTPPEEGLTLGDRNGGRAVLAPEGYEHTW